MKGTAGCELVPEALEEKVARVANDADAMLPEDLSKYQQILLEKQTLNIFESRHADALVKRLGTQPEFVVFGVVTAAAGVVAAHCGAASADRPGAAPAPCARQSPYERRSRACAP